MSSKLRPYQIDDKLAGISSDGEKAKVLNTHPKGEHFVILSQDSITISHSEINYNSKPRKAKHRELLSLKNSILEPVNLDLFDTTQPLDMHNQLHIVILAIKPRIISEPQDKPSTIIVAVPYSKWDGFHLEIELSELIQHYNDTNKNEDDVDLAWPKLKAIIAKEETKIGSA